MIMDRILDDLQNNDFLVFVLSRYIDFSNDVVYCLYHQGINDKFFSQIRKLESIESILTKYNVEFVHMLHDEAGIKFLNNWIKLTDQIN